MYFTERKDIVMDKVLSTFNYGICLFSLEVLQDFLKREKVRSKKLLENFQKNEERYLNTQKEGIWIPIPQINSGQYIIKIDNFDLSFDEEWNLKTEYDGFNLEITNGLWVSDIGSFLSFDVKRYGGNEISFLTGDGNKRYSGFKYDVPSGKYLLTIKGYARKQLLEYPNPNYGFSFSLTKVEEFNGFKNPREDIYDFNIGNM